MQPQLLNHNADTRMQTLQAVRAHIFHYSNEIVTLEVAIRSSTTGPHRTQFIHELESYRRLIRFRVSDSEEYVIAGNILLIG